MKTPSPFHLPVLLLLVSLLRPGVLPAATRTVTSLADSGAGSLRELIAQSAPGDTIDFIVIGTITTADELVVSKSLQILGPGPGVLTLRSCCGGRVFRFCAEAGAVTLAGLTLRDGGARCELQCGDDGQGGAILNRATLTVSNCLLTANYASRTFFSTSDNYGGAIYNGNTLTLVNSTLMQNRVVGWEAFQVQGPGLRGGPGFGGAVYSRGPLTVLNCTFAENYATGGKGGQGYVSGTLIPDAGGDGGPGGGAHLFHDSTSPAQIVHCTFVGGHAEGGLGASGSPPGNRGVGTGGGVQAGQNSLRLLNSIVVSNTLGPVNDPNNGPNVFGAVMSLGHNLIGATNGSTGWQAADLTGSTAAPLEPRLGAFGLNLGSTPTYALQVNSPALNAGNNLSLGNPWFLTTDQRGFPRRASASVDIGAYELCRDLPAFEVTSLGDGTAGSLRAAIECIAPGGTITFAPSVRGTITLTSGELVVDRSVSISGPGANVLAVSGNTASRVFNVTAGTNRISGLSIRNGLLANGGALVHSYGGAVLNQATLTISNCTFLANGVRGANGANGTGGARTGGPGLHAFGGAIHNNGTLSLVSCGFTLNEARAGAGGTGYTGGNAGGNGGYGGSGLGGAICNDGQLTALNCTFGTNRVFGGNGGNGGLAATFDGNGGSGGDAFGGALVNRGTCTLVHATAAGNELTRGAPGTGGEFPGPGPAGVARGGGIAVLAAGPTTTLLNTLVALNRAASDGPDVFGAMSSQGHNLIGATNGSSGWLASDLTGSAATPREAKLGAFGLNLGSTPNYALQTNSPPVNAGDNLSLGSPWFLTTDQRGFPRRASGLVDIGAYELCRDLPAFEVTSLGDGTLGSLRAAIECIAPGGTITFAPSVRGTITLTSGELVVDRSVSISGPGANLLAISGGNALRVFATFPNTSIITLSGLTIRDGLAVSPLPLQAAWGGGILNNAVLTVSNCVFTGNRAVGLNGAVGADGSAAQGGAIYNRATLTLVNSALLQNRAQGGNGGNGAINTLNPGRVGGLGWGGAIYSENPLTLLNCTFATNSAVGGTGGDGGYDDLFDIYGPGGAGGEAAGGHLVHNSPNAGQFVHCTLVGGRAEGGAGGFGELGAGRGPAGLSSAGGVWTWQNTTRLLNTLIASNTLGPVSIPARGPDVLGPFTSQGRNLIAITNGSTGWIASDLTGSSAAPRDPKLGAFGLNFGSTPNYALQAVSPAIDAGDDSVLGAPWFLATDQRGAPRRIGAHVDIGAYEYDYANEPLPYVSLRRGAPGTVVLSWPNPSFGYVLQQTANMNGPGGGWVDVTEPPVIVGPNKQVTLPATGNFCLFRLRKL